ncbi:hypothetical protein PCANC_24682 [Puccinia coronata f. sp. avenae]|uniref:C2H2-type domain-containing protein n=1 Tax=Puccinia coronata f. sp. avenae TaxID=200324 RepID=A0A2N5TZ38_9BASI|nr:hypothetical protein PCANC_24682 [Puccinia coronata f. sp. avenae]
MQQHQPHEPFFSFTVPPKPTLVHSQHSPSLSSLPSSHPHYHPSSTHLLSSIVTDLDCHRTYADLSSRSPSSASPSANSSANRPGTAGPFAFNVPSGTPSTTPSSSLTRLSPHHPPTTASSLAPSLDRPFSSSGLPLASTVPSLHTPQTSTTSHAITHEPHKAGAPSRFPNVSSNQSRSAHPSPLPAPAHMSNCAVNVQHSRPMTAPGSAWVGSHHLGDGLDFASAHVGLFGQAPSYSLQPTSLSAVTLSKTASADFPSSIRHATHSPPGPSSVHTGGAVDPITQAPQGSSSGSSDPDSILPDYAGQSVSPVRGDSATGRPSLGTHSTESTPESPDSSDADHSQNLGYLHNMPPSSVYHTLRPNTHSGTCNSFGHGDRFLAHPVQPRPTTGYPQVYDSHVGYPSIHPQAHMYAPRPPMFPTHSSQIYATGSRQYSHGPGSLELHGQDRLYNFNILPGAPRKRARRRFDEVERLYDCNYPGCTKAYGTLNHLNAHISMQKHGPKRLPQEFKEIRKEWRARKKTEAEARALALKQSATSNMVAAHEYNMLNRQDSFRAHNNVGVSNGSSPSGSSSNSGGFTNMRSPAVGSGGSYSAPAHSQQFNLSDRQAEWYNNDHRLNGTTIDEQPEYLSNQQQADHIATSHSHHHAPLPASSLPPNGTAPPNSSFEEQGFAHHHHPHQGLVASHVNPPVHHHRPAHVLLNHHASSVVDHS